MRLSTAYLSLLGIASAAYAAPVEKRDADFLNVRTKLYKDMSGKSGDPGDKYFRKQIPISTPQSRMVLNVLIDKTVEQMNRCMCNNLICSSFDDCTAVALTSCVVFILITMAGT